MGFGLFFVEIFRDQADALRVVRLGWEGSGEHSLLGLPTPQRKALFPPVDRRQGGSISSPALVRKRAVNKQPTAVVAEGPAQPERAWGESQWGKILQGDGI